MNIGSTVGSLTEPVSGRHWDRPQIRRQILARIDAHQSAGVAPGDRVLILFGNRLELFAELLAIWRLGACAIPIDPRLTPFEVEKLAAVAQARFSVCDDATDPAALAAVAGTSMRNTLESDDVATKGFEAKLADALPRLDDDAVILFTSGSTGSPKGVVHTHRSLLARWMSHKQSCGLERYRRSLCVLPTHFGHGLISNSLFPWLSGCDLFIAPPFKADLIMQLGALLDEHRITYVSSVPSMWNLALKAAAPPEKGSLKLVHIGSAPLSANTWQQVQEWTGTNAVLNAYGTTETASTMAGTTGGKVVPESGLVGEAWSATIKILKAGGDADPISAGIECEPGETGMIWVHTPALMKGYLDRQDLTDAVVRQGWFMTGDLGLLDDRGRLFLRGRERDEINKGGIKVFPADVDEVVEQYPSTRDVCTFAYEDHFYGENVGMAVVLDDQSDRAVVGLHDWIRARLAAHKHPARWYLVDEIARTSRGKINRESVMRACLSGTPLNLREVLSRHAGERQPNAGQGPPA
jgi:acyl-CoA synthetase (AMP-forming)/AMP-acid ligase II